MDDQADHISSQDSAWLTEEERADAKERSDARSDEMNHRKKVQLNIAL
jgi:two-component sensor histidine kinase